LILLAGLAIVVRIVHLAQQSRNLPFLGHPMLDAALYDEWARAIAAGRAFGHDAPFYHSPGYAYVLGALYRVAGPHPLAAVLVQSILGVGTVVLTALLGRRLFGERAGIIAGLLVLASAPFYFFEAKLLDATVSAFLGTLAVFAALHPRTSGKNVLFAVAAGLAGGLLGVVRANLLLVPLLIWVVWLLEYRTRQRPLSEVGAYAAGVLIALAPTFIHNLERGAFVPVASQGGFNFYLGNARGATGVFTDLPGTTGIISTQEAEADSLMKADLGRVLPPGPESTYWTRRTLSEIASDPAHWLRLVGKKTWLYFNRQEENVNGSLELEKEHVWVLRAAWVPFNLLLIMAMIGGALAFRRSMALGSIAIPASLFLATFITCILFFVLTRLRLPAVPVLAVFAGFTLVEAWNAWGSGRRVPVVVGTILVLGLTAITWKSPLGAPRNPAWEASLVIEGAKALEKKGDAAKAAAMFRLASQINPVSVEALLGEAEEAMRAGDVNRTLSLYERARDLAPERFAIHNNLGILYYSLGRMTEAEHEMREAMRLDPRAATPYQYLIEICNASGKVDDARQWQEKAKEAGVDLSAQ
jgi:4-amino-4-deoxy-L-arabinose transferase-like glycosyltransferase